MLNDAGRPRWSYESSRAASAPRPGVGALADSARGPHPNPTTPRTLRGALSTCEGWVRTLASVD
eukprot:6107983-Prymnesium_polylepis.2